MDQDKREHKRFTKRLESDRPQPSHEFESELASRIESSRGRRVSGWRVAIAGAATMVLASAFALTGGIGYAASAVQSGATAVTNLAVKPPAVKRNDNRPSSTTNSPAQGNQVSSARKQYQDKVVICHKGRTIVVSENAVPGHLAHGDTLGRCPKRERVVICHKGRTEVVFEDEVPAHLRHGDTLGRCEKPKRVVICHKGSTEVVFEDDVPAHLRHGDTLGRCPKRDR